MAGGVLCTGNCVFDILVRPVDRLSWGATTWVENIELHLGGNGANTSYTLARLGTPVRLLSSVGRDSLGDELVSRLRAAGVDTEFVSRSAAPTPATVALVNSAGDRLLLHRPGASAEAFPGLIEFTPSIVEGISHYHLANVFALPSFRPHAAETLHRVREAGLSTSLDTGWDALGRWIEDLGPCLQWLDLLFVNEDEARMLTGNTDPAEAAEALIRLGAREVIVKLGRRGCAVFSRDGDIRVPGFHVEVTDTTGAGDCFAGAYLAARQRGCPRQEAARVANAAGALAVRQLGASEALPSWEEMLEWMVAAKTSRQE